jgi:hypothetical protein
MFYPHCHSRNIPHRLLALLASIGLLMIAASPAWASDPAFSNPEEKTETPPPEFHSFAEATQWADTIAIAQVEDINYKKKRSLNASGSAWLKILVPYKGDIDKDDYIEVSAKGFEDWACYYPDRLNEGQRYLVFLKKQPNGQYTGFKPWCQMQVLLDDQGRYALRYPLDANVPVPPEYIQDINYVDPHSRVDATEWSSLRREEWAKTHFAREIVTEKEATKQYEMKYTKGIPVEYFRKLMQLEIKPRITSKDL